MNFDFSEDLKLRAQVTNRPFPLAAIRPRVQPNAGSRTGSGRP
jgi:hypothetical protein